MAPAPARGMALLPRHAPTAAAAACRVSVASRPTLAKRYVAAAMELALCGDRTLWSALARRCSRRRHHDRRAPRRRFPARLASTRGAADGPRPNQCPETLGGGDSARARRRRAASVRPQSALPSSFVIAAFTSSTSPPFRPLRRRNEAGEPRRRCRPADAVGRACAPLAAAGLPGDGPRRPRPFELLLATARGRRRPRRGTWPGARPGKRWEMRRGSRPGTRRGEASADAAGGGIRY